MGDGNIVRISNLYGGECRVVEILQWLENVHLTALMRAILFDVYAITSACPTKAKRGTAWSGAASARGSNLGRGKST